MASKTAHKATDILIPKVLFFPFLLMLCLHWRQNVILFGFHVGIVLRTWWLLRFTYITWVVCRIYEVFLNWHILKWKSLQKFKENPLKPSEILSKSSTALPSSFLISPPASSNPSFTICNFMKFILNESPSNSLKWKSPKVLENFLKTPKNPL